MVSDIKIIAALIVTIFLVTVSPGEEKFSGTTYYLSTEKVVAERSVAGTGYNLSLYQKAENISIVDEDGNPLRFNLTSEFWRGEHNYHLTFDGNVSGNLTYELASQQPQRFITPAKTSEPVRIVLPPGYSTGDRILGIARPDPDRSVASDNGTLLIWRNSTKERVIEIGYYKEGAPRSLRMAFLLLGFIGGILVLEYYLSIRRLRSVRKDDYR